MTQYRNLPASPLIRQFAASIPHQEQLTVLDIGCCMGRNSLLFASLGYTVIGLSKEFDEVNEASQIARARNLPCSFINGDARKLMLDGQFDVVLLNEVLHQMSREDAKMVLASAQELTKPGGFNVVSGYYVNPFQNQVTSGNSYFYPRQLWGAYDNPEWEILVYEEQPTQVQTWQDKDLVSSLAAIVAQRKT